MPWPAMRSRPFFPARVRELEGGRRYVYRSRCEENVVGTFGVLFGFSEVAEDGVEIWSNLAASFTPITAYSFMLFNLLCAPCFAAIGAIRREMNSAKWTWAAIGYQTGFAYAVSLLVYQFGALLAGEGFGAGTVFAAAVFIGLIYLLVRRNRHGEFDSGQTQRRVTLSV